MMSPLHTPLLRFRLQPSTRHSCKLQLLLFFSPPAIASSCRSPAAQDRLFVCMSLFVTHTPALPVLLSVYNLRPELWPGFGFFKISLLEYPFFCQNVSQIKFMFPLKNIKQVVCCPTPLLSSVLLLLRASNSKSTDKATN